MSDRESIRDGELSDAERIELIENHGIDRRSLMKILGVGTLASLGAGTVTGDHDPPHTPHIDSHYGYAAPADEKLPGKLRPDETVELHINESAISPPPSFDRQTIVFHFEPMGLQIEEGDIVRFDFESPEHTITAYHGSQGRQQRVPDDTAPFSSPVVNAGGFWLYEFDSPGTYDLFCGTHEFFGMVMRIVVGDPTTPNYDGINEPPEGRPPVTRAEVEAVVDPGDWPFPVPGEIFDTNALTVSNIASSQNGKVSVSDVENDL